jgi:hypothetical protein
MDSTAERYAKEPVRYPALHVVDLAAEGAAVTEPYRNMVISRVNDSCLRLAVFDEALIHRTAAIGKLARETH